MTEKILAIIILTVTVFVFGKLFIYDLYKAIKGEK